MFRFTVHVERIGRLHLHPVRQLERLDACLELSVLLPAICVPAIERLNEIELPALCRERQPTIFYMLDEFIDRRVLGVDMRALVNAGEKTGLPVLRFLNRVTAGTHDDETRQILVLAAEPVRDPRAHAWSDEPRLATVHQHERRLVVGHVGVHRADHRDVVHALGRVRENLADLRAALSVPLEFVRARIRRSGFALRPQVVHRKQLTGVFLQRRLWVERIHMRRPAVEENVNHPLGLGREMRPLGQERRRRCRAGGVGQHRAKRQTAHADAAAGEKLAPRKKMVAQLWPVMLHRRIGTPKTTALFRSLQQPRLAKHSSTDDRPASKLPVDPGAIDAVAVLVLRDIGVDALLLET